MFVFVEVSDSVRKQQIKSIATFITRNNTSWNSFEELIDVLSTHVKYLKITHLKADITDKQHSLFETDKTKVIHY